MSPRIHQLAADEAPLLEAINTMFGEAFDDPANYTTRRPTHEYLRRLLARDTVIALAALDGDAVVGGLVAYELPKFEQARSELYIYDLAVATTHRRQGVATALIRTLQQIGADRGAWVIFVQADTEAEDEPAIALYSRLGVREEVLHFDIPIPPV